MKYIYLFFGLILISCNKEIEKENPEELLGYGSQGNLLVFEVADTFIKAYEFNLEPIQAWDSMPVYFGENYQYNEEYFTFVTDIKCEGVGSIARCNPHWALAWNGLFPVFIIEHLLIPQEELIENQTEIQIQNDKFKFILSSEPFDYQEAWDKINNYRVIAQYRGENPESEVAHLQ